MTKPKSSEPAVRLQLHGAAQARTPAASYPLRGRAAALVALAALQPGLRREQAAQMLWPDAPNARQNLRQQLLRFRQGLGQALVDGEDTLALAAGVHLEPAPPGTELLAGEPAGDDDFGLWLAAQRVRLAQAQSEPLLQALARAEAESDLDAALQHAQALLTMAPHEEAHHGALMRLHYLRGEPASGLAAFERLSAMLAARFGTQPAAASLELATALRQMGQAAATPPALAHALPVVLKRPPVMAGRHAERAAVQAAWQNGQAVLLEGEAGMGKSRLLAECLQGQPRGVLHAAGRPGDSGAPYSSLARLLRPVLAGSPAALGAEAQAALAVLSGTAAAGAPALAPGAMQAAVAEALDAAGADTVALDDLHFADAASLELLSGLATLPTRRHWLFAQRPAEAPPAAVALRSALQELQRLAVVVLQPLDEAAAAELLDGLALSGLQGTTLAPALVRHSGGNPLFLLETLKQALSDGGLARGELPRPANVGALIDQRLQRLSDPALNLARVAAIAGVDFRIELAESALGQPAVHLANAWQELQQAQVLRDESFAHDLVADAVLRGLPRVVARRVHAQCAAWLQAHGGEAARVARHWLEAGRALEAAQAFTQAAARAHAAARQAEEAQLHGDAAAAFGRAGLDSERFEALASRVNALIGARADDAALAEARALAAAATHDLQRVRAARVLTDLLGQRGPFEEAIAVGREGIALARSAGAAEELVRLAGVTAGNLCKVGAAPEAYGLLLPLREWVDACTDHGLRHIWYGYWAATLGHMGRLREGVAAYDVARAAAAQDGNLPGQSMALLNQCVVLRTMGALERACEASRQGLALAPHEPGNTSHALARLMHARNQAETGFFGEALTTLEDLQPQFEAMGAAFWVWAARGTLARLWQHLGQHARALQALQGAPAEGLPGWMLAGLHWAELEVAQWREQRVGEARVQQALALLDSDTNRRAANQVRGLRFAPEEAVLAQADTLAATLQQSEQFGVLMSLHLHAARAATVQGEAAHAAQHARALLALVAEGYSPEFVYAPEAWLVAAEALDLAGDTPAAQAARAAGVAWVQSRALPRVPAPFIDSFLQRNPVNRRLLAHA